MTDVFSQPGFSKRRWLPWGVDAWTAITLRAAFAMATIFLGAALAPMALGRAAGSAPQPVTDAAVAPVAVAPPAVRAKVAGPEDVARDEAIAQRVAATRSGDMEALQRAVAALEATLPDQSGAGRVATQNELGLAKRLLGQGVKNATLLGDAVKHYRTALSGAEQLGDAATADTIRWNLAIALRLAGDAGGNVGLEREAANLLQQIVAAPGPSLDRVAANKNLGLALLAVGEEDNDMATLRAAANALEAALTDAATDGRDRLDWAETQNALASALQDLGEREWSPDRLQEALKARRNAWVLYQSAGLDTYRFYFETRIAALEKLIEDARTLTSAAPAAAPAT